MTLLALACNPPTVPASPEGEAARLVALEAPALFRRMSLDLRGVVPSIDELDELEADPDGLAAARDALLADPRLEDRIISMLAETWHTRIDVFQVAHTDYQLADEEAFHFVKSVGEEPLRLMARVATSDQPWTDIVTVDYTVADELLAEMWELDYPDDSSGWQLAWYQDGRPAAGVLGTNGLWWRYFTNTSNLNRSRAAATAKLLLCEDYLARQVSFTASTSLADAEGTATAIRTEPACVGCHVSLDPIASSMFGFYSIAPHNRDEIEEYHAEREGLGEELVGLPPGYFGEPIGGLSDLGVRIAEDPRFVRCAATTMARAMWRREVTTDDFDRVEELRDAFMDSGLQMKALLGAITDSEVYRAGSLGDGATDADGEERVVRGLTPDQAASAVEELTGFRWEYLGYDLLQNDDIGYRVLAGGVDGDSVASPLRDPSLTWAATYKRLAEAGAAYAVDTELSAAAESPRVFHHVDLDARPGDASFTAELEDLHWRLYAIRPDAERLAEAEALWTAIEADSDAAEAWKGLLAAMIRHPDFLGY